MNKQIIRLLKNQIYFSTRQIGFWAGSFMLLAYVFVTFLFYCLKFWGCDAASVLDPSEMYAFNDNAPFWQMFSLILPIICGLNFGYQNAENRECGAIQYITFRCSTKEYWRSIQAANFILTFIQMEVASLLSMLLNRIAFPNTRVLMEGAYGNEAFWATINGGYEYRWMGLHLSHPWLYLFVYSILLSLFCAVLSHFLFAMSLLIKKEGLWIIAVAAGVSFFLNELYSIFDYNVWGDVIVFPDNDQSGMLTVFICVSILVVGHIIIRKKSIRWQNE